MTVRLGVNPIGWSNDDMRELGGDIPLETCLAEARGAGFSGIELGHNSDLDLVFLHHAASGGSTDGDKPVSNEQFYARLGQRIVHILSTRTMSGQLYEVDTRLRPSGSAGLLVSSMEAFRKYQLQDAWTWEHQALVRARVVAGDASLAERFEAVRREVLGRERDREGLRDEGERLTEMAEVKGAGELIEPGVLRLPENAFEANEEKRRAALRRRAGAEKSLAALGSRGRDFGSSARAACRKGRRPRRRRVVVWLLRW